MIIVDLFAGPGGWSEGLCALGASDVGIELNDDACATRRAAGHATIQADLSSFGPGDFDGEIDGLIASPPCPDFSAAGKRSGAFGDTGKLIFTVPEWVKAKQPRWVACEQVKEAIKWWKAFASEFREMGYQVATAVLNCADYGVPQTRERAFLLASREFAPRMPEPTHSSNPGQTLLGMEPLKKWVSMSEALGISEEFRVGFPRKDDLGVSLDGYRERDWRTSDRPSFTLTEKSRSWIVEPNTSRDWKADRSREDAQRIDLDRSTPTLATISSTQWIFERPATTVQGDARLWPPGHKVNDDDLRRLGEEARLRYGDRAGKAALRLSVEAALILQTFRHDYPVQGTLTAKFHQIGNAVPPLMAEHLLRQFITSPH